MKTLNKLGIALLALAAGGALAMAQPSGGQPGGNRPPPGEGGPGPGHRPPPLPAIIAALDANGDGIIDATEIANASAALMKLDANGDGQLTREEYLGHRPEGPGGAGQPNAQGGGPGAPGGRGGRFGPPKEILEKYDVNKDGHLDEAERAALEKDIADGKLPPPPGRRGPGGPPPAGSDQQQ